MMRSIEDVIEADEYDDYRVDVYSNSAMHASVVTHYPTGVRKSCDRHRSQILNTREAFAEAIARVEELRGTK